MSDHEWVDLCCVECRRIRRVTQYVANLGGMCRHTGTSIEKGFWRAAGEPNAAMRIDDKHRKEDAKAADERMKKKYMVIEAHLLDE